MNVTYPKFKMGDEVVREIAEPATYGMYMYWNFHCIFLKFRNKDEGLCFSFVNIILKLELFCIFWKNGGEGLFLLQGLWVFISDISGCQSNYANKHL